MVDTIRRAEVDIALMPAHLARIAVADWRWEPLAGTLASTPVMVLTRGAGPVRSVADLRGRQVGMLDLLSLSAAVAVRWLDEQGLDGPGGAEVVTVPSINSALIALERDELAAVVVSGNQLASLPPQTPTGQRRLASIENIRALVFAARPQTAPDLARRWRQALLAFEPDPSKPRTVSNARLEVLAANELEAQEPYAAFLRRQLATGR
jgi:ABC-type phosphate/phosphonate transport system substrate-binding protein